MAYLRCGSILKYVEGKSEDYVFPTSKKKGKKWVNFIEDYGGITNEGLVEMFCEHIEVYDSLLPSFDRTLTEYLLKRLAEKLKVKLRKKPLTEKQLLKFWYSKKVK